MLLKSLKVKDFRQLKGIQQISFATDRDRNVTVIMGENGTGKTTLAQAFTWCLYGDTSFEDKIVLSKSTSGGMPPNSEENARAELTLVHNETEYTIISDQKYKKDNSGTIKPVGQRSFSISYKKADGTCEFVKPLDAEMRMKEILPRELSKYFFFDGERIEAMSKDITRGHSTEFAGAVKNLLGLSSYTSALTHLKNRGNNCVLHVYEQSYDARSNVKIAELSKIIADIGEQITKIDDRLEEIEVERTAAQDKITDLTEKIAKNKNSEDLAKQKDDLKHKMQNLGATKSSQIKSIMRAFNNGAASYFAKRLMKDALNSLSISSKLDKGVPNINDKTIQFLIENKKCICGAEIKAGNSAFNELTKLLEYIPPKSIGNMITEFVGQCETRNRSVQDYYPTFCESFRSIIESDSDYADCSDKIGKIENQLAALESVGGLQAKLSSYEKALANLSSENSDLNINKGGLMTKKKEHEAERKELANKDSTNKKIEVYKAYAQYMFDHLSDEYAMEEGKMRDQLQAAVNGIFKEIYNGGFSLVLDEKYNIQINVIDQSVGIAQEVETSTAQSISVIFAFIAGVIQMARKSKEGDTKMLEAEPYPLVMDAPLSAFDKKRIKTVCEVLPGVAEQIIIFIKDTDGDLAKEHLGAKVGKQYQFSKKSEIETYIL